MRGLREQKKEATRVALREAALRLAVERGPDNVRVDDIAEAAGVSPRTYNNYFSSREEAIVAALIAEREARVAAAVSAQPAGVRLSTALIDAVVAQYTNPGRQERDAVLMITTRPALRDAYLRTAAALEHPLADAIARRLGEPDGQTAQVLAASVAAAVRLALERWLQPAGNGLVVVSDSLGDLIKAAIAPLVPALDAAEEMS